MARAFGAFGSCGANFACSVLVLAMIALGDPAMARDSALQLTFGYPDVVNDPTRLDFQPVCNAKLEGPIKPGDYEREVKPKFDAFVANPEVAPLVERWRQQAANWTRYGSKPDSLDPGFFALCLTSEGGDLKEALMIARLFEGWMMVVGVDEYDHPQYCLSACAVIFMSAKRRDGIYGSSEHRRFPGRFLHHKAKLGFHAPRLEFPAATTTVSREQAQEAYAAAISSVRQLMEERRSPHFFDRETFGRYQGADFPADLLLVMLTTPPESMREVQTVADAIDWGIDVYGFEMPKSLTSHSLLAACATATATRCEHSPSQDRCDDAFVQPAMLISRGPAVLPGDTAALIADHNEFVRQALQGYTIKHQTLWPGALRSGRIEAAYVETASAPYRRQIPCAVITTWRGDELLNIEVQSFNGPETDWLRPADDNRRPDRAALQSTAGEVEQGRYRADTMHHMRLLRLLPLNARLDSLEGDIWNHTAAAKPAFATPVTWSKR